MIDGTLLAYDIRFRAYSISSNQKGGIQKSQDDYETEYKAIGMSSHDARVLQAVS
jgi:hypothetical protein